MLENARRGVHVRGQDRQLPALPGAGIDVDVLQRDRQQAGGDLLAGGDDGVVFAGVEDRRFLSAASHQATS